MVPIRDQCLRPYARKRELAGATKQPDGRDHSPAAREMPRCWSGWRNNASRHIHPRHRHRLTAARHLEHHDALDAPQRTAAARWIEEAFDGPGGVGFTWHALAGFLRLSTQQRIVPTALPLGTALGVIDTWLAHPHAHVIGPTDRHAPVLARLLIGAGQGGNLVSDAHLAAIAIEHGAVLGTFDRDFERFAGLRMDWLQGDATHGF